MPIKGLTDQARPAFPSIGKLRKGAPKVREDRPGEDLTYFRFTSERPEIEAEFKRCYGEQPREINVYLPHASIADNLGEWQELWKAGGLQHRCDGETCVVWLQDNGEYSNEPKPCPGGCKPVGRLSVILPELFTAGYVGYVTLETHGLHDLLSLQGSLMAAVEARGTEDLRGIGFVLRRVAQAVSTPELEKGVRTGKRLTRTKSMVKIEPAIDWIRAQLAQSRRVAMHLLPSVAETIDTDTEPTEQASSTGPLRDTDVVDTDARELDDDEGATGEDTWGEPIPGAATCPPSTRHWSDVPAANGDGTAGLNAGQRWMRDRARANPGLSTGDITRMVGSLGQYATERDATEALASAMAKAIGGRRAS